MTPIENVIRRVDSMSIKLDAPSEQLIIAEVSGKGQVKVLASKPLITFTKDIRYYLVSMKKKAIVRNLSCSITTIKSQLNLIVDYSVTCQYPEKVVEKLVAEKNIQQRLDQFIIEWVMEYPKTENIEDETFISDFYVYQDRLAQSLADNALQLGLLLNIDIRPENAAHLKAITIKSESETSGAWEVRVKDYAHTISLTGECGLQVTEAGKAKAAVSLNVESRLRAIVRREVAAYLLEHITLQSLRTDLNSTIKQQIIARINGQCEKYGRSVTYLNLTAPDNLINPPEHPVIHHEVTDCRITDYSKSISVSNEVLIRLEDIGLYRSSSINALDEWIKEQLDTIVQEELFDQTYLDILLNLDGPKGKIKFRLEEGLKSVGYAVKHHLVVPNLAPLKLREGFKIRKEATLVTKDSRVPINLEITIRGKIEDLTICRVKSLVESMDNVEEVIEEEAIEAAEAVISRLNPDEVFMDFHASRNIKDTSVEKKLEESMKDVLKEFGIVNLRITLKLLESDITRYLQIILQAANTKKLNGLKIDVSPLRNEENSERVTFELEYQLRGVHPDGWFVFQSNVVNNEQTDFEGLVSAINLTLKRDIASVLETFPMHNLRYGSVKDLNVIRRIIELKIKQTIAKAYGLSIDLIVFKRGVTLWEQERLATNAATAKEGFNSEREAVEIVHKARMKELTELNEKRAELLKADPEMVEEELASVTKKIEEIVNEMPRYQIGQKTVTQKKLQAPKKDDFSYDDYISSSKQLEKGTSENSEKDETEDN